MPKEARDLRRRSNAIQAFENDRFAAWKSSALKRAFLAHVRDWGYILEHIH
jgi:hypothetical protein